MTDFLRTSDLGDDGLAEALDLAARVDRAENRMHSFRALLLRGAGEA